MFRIDCNQCRRAERDLIAGEIVLDVNVGQRAAAVGRWLQEPSCCLQLAGCNRIPQRTDFAFEYATRHGVKCDFGFVPGLNALETVLLEGVRQLLVTLFDLAQRLSSKRLKNTQIRMGGIAQVDRYCLHLELRKVIPLASLAWGFPRRFEPPPSTLAAPRLPRVFLCRLSRGLFHFKPNMLLIDRLTD